MVQGERSMQYPRHCCIVCRDTLGIFFCDTSLYKPVASSQSLVKSFTILCLETNGR